MLPSEIVKQVKRIQFQTGRHVADVLAGEYLSVFKGQGMEFEEVRPYVPGDDVRSIDWNVTARTGSPFVKRYVEERELTVLLLVDVSASQDFGSAARSKREAAVQLSALLAFSAIHNDDKVGLLLFHGEVEEYIPPRKGQKHALRVVREVLARGEEIVPAIDEPRGLRPFAIGEPRGLRPFAIGEVTGIVPPSAEARPGWLRLPEAVRRQLARLRGASRKDPRRSTRIGHALEFCQRVLPRRAVLFLVSDFLDQGYLPALRSARRRHDLVAVLMGDERERLVEGAGIVALEDAETGERQLVDTSSRAYQEAVQAEAARRGKALEMELRSSGIDLLRIDATRPVVDPLLQFFRMRQRRRRRR